MHAYWDRLFGGSATPYGAIFDADEKGGLASVTPDPAEAQIADPAIWAEESADLAKRYAYAPPVTTAAAPVMLNRDYETNARNVARHQAALAAARLANLLNATPK